LALLLLGWRSRRDAATTPAKRGSGVWPHASKNARAKHRYQLQVLGQLIDASESLFFYAYHHLAMIDNK